MQNGVTKRNDQLLDWIAHTDQLVYKTKMVSRDQMTRLATAPLRTRLKFQAFTPDGPSVVCLMGSRLSSRGMACLWLAGRASTAWLVFNDGFQGLGTFSGCLSAQKNISFLCQRVHGDVVTAIKKLHPSVPLEQDWILVVISSCSVRNFR
jgi:hypothetical protein